MNMIQGKSNDPNAGMGDKGLNDLDSRDNHGQEQCHKLEDGKNNAEQSARAKANWGKLRNHIKAMRQKANFLVTFLDDENEMKQENMYGFDADR